MIYSLVNYQNYEYILNNDEIFQKNKTNYENLVKIINEEENLNNKYYIYYLLKRRSNEINNIKNEKFHISHIPFIFKYNNKLLKLIKSLNILNKIILLNDEEIIKIYVNIINNKYLIKNKILSDYLIMHNMIDILKKKELKLGINTNFEIKKIKLENEEKKENMIKKRKSENKILKKIDNLKKNFKINYLNKLSLSLLKNNYYYCYKKMKERYAIDHNYILSQAILYFINKNLVKELSYLLENEYKNIDVNFYNFSFLILLITKGKLEVIKIFSKYKNFIPTDIYDYNIDNIKDKEYFTKKKQKKEYICIENMYIYKNIKNITTNYEKLGIPINECFVNCYMNYLSDEEIMKVLEKNYDLNETINYLIFYRKWKIIDNLINKGIITKEYYFEKYNIFINKNLKKYIKNIKIKYIIKQKILLNIIKIIKYNFFKFKIIPQCLNYYKILFLLSLSIKNINFSILNFKFKYTKNDLDFFLDNYCKVIITSKNSDFIDIIDIYFLLENHLNDKKVFLNFKYDVIKLQNIILKNYEIIKNDKLEYLNKKNLLENFTFKKLFTYSKIEIIIFLFQNNKLTINLENLFKIICHLNDNLFESILNKIKLQETDIDLKFFKYIIFNNISDDKILFIMNKLNIQIDYRIQIISFIKLIRNKNNFNKYHILNLIKNNYKYIPLNLYNYIKQFIQIYINNQNDMFHIACFLQNYIQDLITIQIPENQYCHLFMHQVADSIYNYYNINRTSENNFLNYL